jgi:hypothetical protein
LRIWLCECIGIGTQPSVTTSLVKEQIAPAAIEIHQRRAEPALSVAYRQIHMARSGRARHIRHQVKWVHSFLHRSLIRAVELYVADRFDFSGILGFSVNDPGPRIASSV